MDRTNGKLIPLDKCDEIVKSHPELKEFFAPVNIPLTLKQERTLRIGRNDKCPCGSGRKFKKCCLLAPEKEKE